jgi:hypothetical protein
VLDYVNINKCIGDRRIIFEVWKIANAILLPGSAADDTTDSLTNYYMIDETPPLVTLLSDIPVIGQPLADLLGPDLTVLINLGYGADNLGYSTPANVPTPFGLFPDVSLSNVLTELTQGAQQGFSAFEAELSDPSAMASTVADPSTAVAVATTAADLPSLSDIGDALSSAGASLYALGLQTADIADAVVVSLPAYDGTLFLDNLTNPLDAIGLPLAADTGLLTVAGGFEFQLVDQAITAVVNDITSLFP